MIEMTTVPSRRREATRQRLLDAAARVFAEVGLDAASVEAICEAAGYTRGAFYSNFASKEELFLALCARSAEAQLTAVRGVVAELERDRADDRPSPTLLELVQRVLEASADDRAGAVLLSEVRSHALRTPSIADAYRAQASGLSVEVAQILRDLVRVRGIDLRIDAETAAELLLAMWIAAAERAVIDGLDGAALRERIVAALMRVVDLVLSDEK